MREKRPDIESLTENDYKKISKKFYNKNKQNFESYGICEKDIYKVFQTKDIDNGYENAKKLEHFSKNKLYLDCHIVKTLNYLKKEIRKRLSKNIEKWVKENEIKANKSSGEILYFNDNGIKVAPIISIDYKKALYKVPTETVGKHIAVPFEKEVIKKRVEG